MKIALINTIKPQEGSGDGATEITYRLYRILSKKHDVHLFYPLENSVRNNVMGLTYTNTIFKNKVAGIAHSGYDIVHITNQELGFVARILKKAKSRAKVVTTLFDVVRVRAGFRNGVVHGVYNKLITGSIRDAVEFSDALIFVSSSVMPDVKKEFPRLKNNWSVVYLGQPRDKFIETPIPKKKTGGVIRVGYVGALSKVKNVSFILKTAKLLQNSNYKFIIYGTGLESGGLKKYKEANHLENVSFMGFAPEKDLLKIYDAFDIFFFPTLDESTSIPAFDAKARGLPIVLYGKTKLSEEVRAHTFIADNEEHAAKILEKLRTKGFDPKLKNAEVKQARSYTWERAARETEDVYKHVLK